MGDSGAPPPEEDFRPPTGSWRRLHALVVSVLLVEIVLLWLLSRAFP
ncbi:MAG: hypothetical protein WCS72_13655 [Deltaproteobacteria bacterium]